MAEHRVDRLAQLTGRLHESRPAASLLSCVPPPGIGLQSHTSPGHPFMTYKGQITLEVGGQQAGTEMAGQVLLAALAFGQGDVGAAGQIPCGDRSFED